MEKEKLKTTYRIRGKIDLSKIEKTSDQFTLKAYAVRDGKVLGVGVPDGKGAFVIEFEYPSETRIGVKVIVAPDIPEKYYDRLVTRNTCMETSEHTVSALKWKKGRSFDFNLGVLTIQQVLYDHWILWTRPFNVYGVVRWRTTGRGVPHAIVDAFEVDCLPSGEYRQDFIGSDIANICGNFHIIFPWFLVLIPQGRPDLTFRVSQNVDGSLNVIYDEDPTQVRWDMVDGTWVHLWVEEDCLTFHDPPSDRPGDCSFLFTRVGLICVDRINGNGYAESSLLTPPGTQDAPFGRNLHLCGWFGESSDVTHYKIQVSKDGGAFKDISEPLSNKYYAGGGKWTTVSMGPMELGGKSNLYTTPYLLDRTEGASRAWWFPDLLARWNTTKAEGDGKYTIRIDGHKWDSIEQVLVPVTCLDIDPYYGELKLQIDNSPPVSRIKDILHVNPSPLPIDYNPVVKPCDIREFGSSDSLRVHIEASDSNGHLGGYRLEAMYGHDCSVAPRPPGAEDTYSPAHINPTQKWTGGAYAVIYKASAYGTTNGTCIRGTLPSCAYQFRLGVWKRTTNGYGLIYHWVEDTMHITIKRT